MFNILDWPEEALFMLLLIAMAFIFIETLVAMQFFRLFGLGKIVLKGSKSFHLNANLIRVNEVIETESGDYKFISDHECLFRNRIQFFNWPTRRGPFLKGTLRFENGRVYVRGRAPVGPMLYGAGFFLLMFVTGFRQLVESGQPQQLAITFLFAGFFALMWWVIIQVGKNDLLKVFDEIEAALSDRVRSISPTIWQEVQQSYKRPQ